MSIFIFHVILVFELFDIISIIFSCCLFLFLTRVIFIPYTKQMNRKTKEQIKSNIKTVNENNQQT